jgi:RND family efflux transporter MFP subunit
VLDKNVVEGARLTPGMNLFTIADLSRVWVEAEVFERDLSLVSEGQHAVVTFQAYPGETFHGSVTYVYPTVSPQGRTGRVRLELPNPGMRIKPGMYATVELHGPPLGPTLLVPRSAVLETGERSVVFHRMSSGELHPMEVVPGLRGEEQIQILSGLQEGQIVVSSATFLIDAESNLGAAMAGMAGMDHSGMDMGGESETDHSQHEMEGMNPDTAGTGMDHSQHQMEGMGPDTAQKPMDHSGHGTGGS